MRKYLILISGLLILLASACSHRTPAKGEYEQELSFEKFVDPPVAYRSHVFYSLNDRLEPEELKRQIHDFKAAGLGGYYLHSRVGLLTEYLGDDWWTAMDAAVDAALETGLQAYFYDEDRWPSGYAGGLIPLMDEAYRARSLARLELETPLPPGAVELTRDEDYKYVEYAAELGVPGFNGTSFVDLMNPDAVAAFIAVTHEEYVQRYLDKLPYSFAFFSDEPHIHARYFHSGTPHKGLRSYSPFVRERFLKDFGYDIVDKVALLFEEKGNWREVRLQYQQTVARQFEEAFTRQIAAYCEAHGLKYTGHYLGEESLGKVAERIGNSMLHYRNMQMPGIDLLGMSLDNRLITARSLSSVANQYAIPRRMSELFGISGHNTSFQDRKRIGNWHAINGINHFVPHLTLYSLKGLRKRDYPPTFSYHQPYWAHNALVEDYLGRISYAATIGKYQPQILVLNPLESEYMLGRGEFNFTENVLRRIEALQALNYDYDLGDEEILADLARTEKGKLKVGDMSYDLVMIPDMISLRSSTLKLLEQFIQQGGKVAAVGDRFPEFVDGRSGNERLERLQEACLSWEGEAFEEGLRAALPATVKLSAKQDKEVWSQVRKVEGGHLIMLTNMCDEDKVRFRIESRLFTEDPVLWDPAAGKSYALESDDADGYWLELEPSGLVWLTTGRLSDDARISSSYASLAPYEGRPQVVTVFDEDWTLVRHDPNALVLDFARFSLDNGKTWSASEPITGIFDRLADLEYRGKLLLRYEWEAAFKPKSAALAVEQADRYLSISVNGEPLQFSGTDHYVDRGFLSTAVEEFLHVGNNTAELSLDFSPPVPGHSDALVRYGTEIESIYLLGDFAVKGLGHEVHFDTHRNHSGIRPEKPAHRFTAFEVVAESTVTKGDLVPDGYPFYSGSIGLHTSFEMAEVDAEAGYFLELPLSEAMVVEISINGHDLEPMAWAPFRAEIGNFLQEGANALSIRLTNSLRNLLGPHHHSWKEMIRVGPSSFSGNGGFPNPRGVSKWYDVRVDDGKAAYWRDEYYHIPFGFLEAPVLTRVEKR